MTHYLTVEIPVPDEATHIAQDMNGEWHFFCGRPLRSFRLWHGDIGRPVHLGIAYTGKPNRLWRDQCYEIERK